MHIPTPTTTERGNCPVCRDTESTAILFRVRTIADYGVARCRRCGFVFTLPRPTPRELDEFYTSHYFRRPGPAGLGYENYREIAEVNTRRMWPDLNTYFDLERVRPRRLLDVGCATGGFLAQAKAAGWECRGVELSEDAVKVARGEFGLDVVRADLQSVAFDEGQFGLVTMWHVLEHMIDPIDSLQRAHRLIAKGGYLFVELPNWASFGRVIRRRRWAQLKPPEHINFFTPKSLAYAAHQRGFEVVRCDTQYPSIKDRAAIRRLTRPLYQLQWLVAAGVCHLGRGGYLRLLARKQ